MIPKAEDLEDLKRKDEELEKVARKEEWMNEVWFC